MDDLSNQELFNRITSRLDESDRKADRRFEELENRFRGLERLFYTLQDEIASFRRSYNNHRHGPPE